MSEVTYHSMSTGVIFCSVCPYTKIGYRRTIVLCTTYSGEGRCEEHRDVPDTELPVEPDPAPSDPRPDPRTHPEFWTE